MSGNIIRFGFRSYSISKYNVRFEGNTYYTVLILRKQRIRMPLPNTKQFLNGFFQLLFPASCIGCGRHLVEGEAHLCTYCINDMPKTHFHHDKHSPLERKFYGKGVPVEAVWAYYYFYKGGKARKLVHQLKYEGKKDIGYAIGRWYGYELRQDVEGLPCDCIVPVPLHRQKLARRGFNQSKVFAEGLSAELSLPVEELLEKKLNIQTQTAKTRLERWLNSRNAYTIKSGINVKGKRVLLVDDILTTGATLETCAGVLLQHGAKSIHIAVIAAGQ